MTYAPVHTPLGTETEPCGDVCIRTLAMPADTNANGDIFGGWLLSRLFRDNPNRHRTQHPQAAAAAIGNPVDASTRNLPALTTLYAGDQPVARGMSDSYIIQVSSQAAGIVVRQPGGYRFFAATHRFNRLEGQLFRSARETERAAARLLAGVLPLEDHELKPASSAAEPRA